MISIEQEQQEKEVIVKGNYRFNTIAESYLLSSLFVNPFLILECRGLTPDDFFRIEHRILFFEILAVFDEHKTLIPSLIVENIKKRIRYADYMDTINSIVYSSIGNENFNIFLDIVLNCSKRRKMTHLGKELVELSYVEEVDVLIEKSEKVFLSLISNKELQKSFHISQKNESGISSFIEDIFKPDEKISSIDTSFACLDTIFNGFFPSEVTVLASRTGMGKTSLCISLMINISRFQKKRILFFSLEMSKYHIMSRIISNISSVALTNILKKNINEEDAYLLNFAKKCLTEMNITIFDIANLSITDLKSISRMEYLKEEVDMIFIDYIQLISVKKHMENRQSELAFITCEIKELARNLNIPIVILSQLSRMTEQNDNKQPNIWNIKSSGAIEEHFDNILLMYRKDYYEFKRYDATPKSNYVQKEMMFVNERESDRITSDRLNKSSVDNFKYNHQTEITVAKQRNGKTGKVSLLFKSKYATFVDYDEEIES